MTVDESGGQSSSHGQPASKIRMASSASGSVASSGGSGGNGGGGGGLAPSTSPSNTGEIHHHPHHQHHRPQLHHPVPVAGTAVGAGQQQMPATAVAPGKSPPTSGQTAAATMTFERFLKMQPAKAEQALEQLIEVTGIKDRKVLFTAFNETWKASGGEFNVTLAIEWVLNLQNSPQDSKRFQAKVEPPPTSSSSLLTSSTSISDQSKWTNTNLAGCNLASSGSAVQPPPNSPTGTVSTSNKALVDLTDSGSGVREVSSADSDLERAIQLSLQEANRSYVGGQVSQEDQDVSRALEDWLMDSQGQGKRKRIENWKDPLNPHDRKRNGLWPVGLKNVGQTCWFSAVIQSLFFLPAFRRLVLNYQPPQLHQHQVQPNQASTTSENMDSSSVCAVSSSTSGPQGLPASQPGFSTERQKKIIEFMLELRKLFALMVASQRRYVDPSRAVDILRGSLGSSSSSSVGNNANRSGNGNGGSSTSTVGPTDAQSIANKGGQAGGGDCASAAPSCNVVVALDNNQQDVSEFTHIVLEWVEEAFKSLVADEENGGGGSSRPEQMDQGGDLEDDIEGFDDDDQEGAVNPMSRLFYGQVLLEGSFKGQPFVRTEAFGQWPLQVNTFQNIHESLENSTAHETIDQANNVLAAPQATTTTASTSASGSGQERWFTTLPPVLFFELSRFHYNTEKKAAEKIHNRLEFPEVIFMDRYTEANKAITRVKREEVRKLKDRRAHLSSRLEKYVNYAASFSGSSKQDDREQLGGQPLVLTCRQQTDPQPIHYLSLPDVLRYSLGFATSATAILSEGVEDVNMTPPRNNQDELPTSPDASSSSTRTLKPAQGPASLGGRMLVDSPCGSPMADSSGTNSKQSSNGGNVRSPSVNLKEATAVGEVPMEIEVPALSEETSAAAGDGAFDQQVAGVEGCDTVTDSHGSSAAIKPFTDVDMNAGDSTPRPKQVSEVELRILQNCLSRWIEEVDQDITNLKESIREVDRAIEDMYSDPELKLLEYHLHAVMVHEGGVDSGHYWAYVKDHRRKVWLKFNDITVNEASWDELIKESVGGHSNTSAYSLVYIDSSKPELLQFNVAGVSAIGVTSDDKMSEGELEALALSLPADLTEFVVQDNDDFHKEILQWNVEQEQLVSSKRQESNATASTAEFASSATTSLSDANNDVQVVQEKLTHVNTHAKLSIKTTFSVIQAIEGTLNGDGVSAALDQALKKTHLIYAKKLRDLQNERRQQELLQQQQQQHRGGSSGFRFITELPATDMRLESFCIYLLDNGVSDNLFEMALLEQFSSPGLDTNDPAAAKIRQFAEQTLRQKRNQHPGLSQDLKHLHQSYHWFRMSAHSFVAGLEYFCQHKFEDCLKSFIQSYVYTVKLNDPSGPQQPVSASRGLRSSSIVRFLCLALPELNGALIDHFRMGERINEVVSTVRQVVVPVLVLLQNHLARDSSQAAAKILEGIRCDWCALLGESDVSNSEAVSQILRLVLEPPADALSVQLAGVGGRRHEFVDQVAELQLADKYCEVVRQLHKEVEISNAGGHCKPSEEIDNRKEWIAGTGPVVVGGDGGTRGGGAVQDGAVRSSERSSGDCEFACDEELK